MFSSLFFLHFSSFSDSFIYTAPYPPTLVPHPQLHCIALNPQHLFTTPLTIFQHLQLLFVHHHPAIAPYLPIFVYLPSTIGHHPLTIGHHPLIILHQTELLHSTYNYYCNLPLTIVSHDPSIAPTPSCCTPTHTCIYQPHFFSQ